MQTIMKVSEKNFLYAISNIRKRAFSFLQNEMKKIGVNDIPPSYGDILYAVKAKNGICLKDISEMSHKDKSTVSLIINALEKNGYVTKEKDEKDGRSVKIKLTKKAERYTGSMMSISEGLQKKLFSEMSEEEKSIFFMLLNKISKNI